MATTNLSPSRGAIRTLIIPGIDNSDADHWQTIWEAENEDFLRVDLGDWRTPRRNSWVNHLNAAIRTSDQPTVLVAHSLGCLAVAWWAALERPSIYGPVIGALLVAPPNVDASDAHPRIAGWGPAPLGVLPFRSILVASSNDRYATLDYSRRLAFFWGSSFVRAGPLGHINSQSGIGRWEQGLGLLDLLVDRSEPPAVLEQSLAARAEEPVGDAGHWV